MTFLLTPDARRFAAAAGASLACHALVAMALARISTSSGPRPRPIVVTMLPAGGGDGGAGAPAAAPAAPPPAEEPARAPAVVARAAPVVPARRALRTAPPPRPRAPSAAREPAPTVDGPTASAAAGAPASADGVAGGAGGAADGAGNAGEGAGGADGLRAFCRSCPAPAYPSRARRQGWEGTVEVGLRVAADGSVASASVERSSGYPTLDDVALASARASRFAVPTGGGLDGRLRYRFLLDETAAER